MSYEYRLKGANISADGLYRYWLSREWQLGKPDEHAVCWIMLNPSTADASEDDPTIRKCANFTNTWGYQRLWVVNLFAYRSVLPKMLSHARDPVGPENDATIRETAVRAKLVVCAWGNSVPKEYPSRPNRVRELLFMSNIKLKCLGKNSDGSPKHPLYLKNTTELIDL